MTDDLDHRSHIDGLRTGCGYLARSAVAIRACASRSSAGSTTVARPRTRSQASSRPVLAPAIEEERDFGSRLMSRTRARRRTSAVRFGLVSRGDQMTVWSVRVGRRRVNDEADGDEPRPSVLRDRRQGGGPALRHEGTLSRARCPCSARRTRPPSPRPLAGSDGRDAGSRSRTHPRRPSGHFGTRPTRTGRQRHHPRACGRACTAAGSATTRSPGTSM